MMASPVFRMRSPTSTEQSGVWVEPHGPLPSIWDLLDKRSNETLHLLSLEEFTDIVNGCAPDALVRNSFVILRIVVMTRYLQLKT